MFENLSDRLTKSLKNISGRGRLTEDNIKDTLREVRMALLEADVVILLEVYAAGELSLRKALSLQ